MSLAVGYVLNPMIVNKINPERMTNPSTPAIHFAASRRAFGSFHPASALGAEAAAIWERSIVVEGT
jgi:hypothetical protein